MNIFASTQGPIILQIKMDQNRKMLNQSKAAVDSMQNDIERLSDLLFNATKRLNMARKMQKLNEMDALFLTAVDNVIKGKGTIDEASILAEFGKLVETTGDESLFEISLDEYRKWEGASINLVVGQK